MAQRMIDNRFHMFTFMHHCHVYFNQVMLQRLMLLEVLRFQTARKDVRIELILFDDTLQFNTHMGARLIMRSSSKRSLFQSWQISLPLLSLFLSNSLTNVCTNSSTLFSFLEKGFYSTGKHVVNSTAMHLK